MERVEQLLAWGCHELFFDCFWGLKSENGVAVCPLTYHLGGDFDDGEIMIPVGMGID